MRLGEKTASQLMREGDEGRKRGDRKSEFCENSSQSEHQSRGKGRAEMKEGILQEQTTHFLILPENSRNKSD